MPAEPALALEDDPDDESGQESADVADDLETWQETALVADDKLRRLRGWHVGLR